MNQLTNWARFVRGAFLFLIIIIPFSNVGRGLYNQINANDFSIYQQAIYNIADGVSFNPFLTIRSANIFNDHADPAVFFAAAFTKIFGYDQNTLYFFEWLWFVFSIIALFLITKKLKVVTKTNDFLFYVMPFMVFSRSLLQGLEFPIHPTTWSMFPLILSFYFIKIDAILYLLGSLFFLLLFRESFPFAVMGLSLHFLIKKRWGSFGFIFLLGLAIFSLLTIVRPMVLGPVVNYGQGLIKELALNPFGTFWSRLMTFTWPIKELFPPLTLFGIYFYLKIKELKKKIIFHPAVAVILFVGPLFGLHLLSNYLVHHHSIPIAVPLTIFPLLSKKFVTFLKENKKVFLVVLLLFIGTSSSKYTKMVKAVFRPPYESQILKERYISLQKIDELVKEIPLDKKIMATGGIIPRIMAPRRLIYQFVEITPKDLVVDYLLLELNYHGDLNPIAKEDVFEIKENCLKFADKILFQDDYFILMEGKFSDECLGITKRWPLPSTYLPI